MQEEEPCLVLGWAHVSESMQFRMNGGLALLPPREYRPPWTRSCSTRHVEALVAISFLQDGGYLRLGRDIAFARWMHHDRDTRRTRAWFVRKFESDPVF